MHGESGDGWGTAESLAQHSIVGYRHSSNVSTDVSQTAQLDGGHTISFGWAAPHALRRSTPPLHEIVDNDFDPRLLERDGQLIVQNHSDLSVPKLAA